jgi:hypothetical protein
MIDSPCAPAATIPLRDDIRRGLAAARRRQLLREGRDERETVNQTSVRNATEIRYRPGDDSENLLAPSLEIMERPPFVSPAKRR